MRMLTKAFLDVTEVHEVDGLDRLLDVDRPDVYRGGIIAVAQ